MQGTTEECWTRFKNIINYLVSRYIPRKKPNQKVRKKALWMANKAVQLVRKNIRHLRSIRHLSTQLESEQQRQQIKKSKMPKPILKRHWQTI